MRIGLFISICLSLLTLACSENTNIDSHRWVKHAPTSAEDLGWLVSNTTKDEIDLLLQEEVQAKVRVISAQHGLFEVYGLGKNKIEKYLPKSLITKNDFIKPLNEQKIVNELSFFKQNNSQNIEEASNKADPNLCLEGKTPPTASFLLSKKSEADGNTIELGQKFTFNSSSSYSHAETPSKLKTIWVIQPPEGSLKTKEFFYGTEVTYQPDAMGAYMVALLVQDDNFYCDFTAKTFNVTSNENLQVADDNDLLKNQFLSINLKSFDHLLELNIPQAWTTTTGKNQIIAVIDSGVNYNHFSLKNNILTNSNEIPNNGIDDDNNGFVDDYVGYDFINSDPFPFDDHGHGSHVAGLAASQSFGVAKDAKILAVKTMSPSGGDTGTLIGGILYAVDRGANIINISLGNYGKPHAQLIAAMNYAEEHGTLVVAAAGNGDYTYGLPVNTDLAPNFPSALPNKNIIAVAAHSKNKSLAIYSNYGKESVDIAAPGGDDQSPLFSAFLKNPAGIEIKGMSGTSMASPVVAGVAALIWSANPQLNFSEIKSIMLSTGTLVDDLKDKLVSGSHLNPNKAIEKTIKLLTHTQD